jgi:hypothetical protein
MDDADARPGAGAGTADPDPPSHADADANPGSDAGTAYRGDLRGGGRVEIATDALWVDRDGETGVRVALDDVAAVSVRDVDWFLAVTSLALAGFGVLSLERNVLLGAGFAAAGLASLYLTYRKRDAVTVRVTGRSKPLRLYPADAGAFAAAMADALDGDEQ